MTKLRLVGIAILVICALSAIGASAANAEEPALITYSGSGAFTINSTFKGKLETSDKLTVTCVSATGTGQLGGKGGSAQAKTAELTILFQECETAGKPCTSSGQPSGSIITNRLLATLGRISPTKAGILLQPKAPATTFIVGTKCGTITFVASSSVIGELTPVDKQTTALTAKFVPSTERGLQAIKKFEGEATVNNLIADVGRGPEEASLETEATITLVNGSGILLA